MNTIDLMELQKPGVVFKQVQNLHREPSFCCGNTNNDYWELNKSKSQSYCILVAQEKI